MLKNERRKRGAMPDDGILRYLRFAVLPLVVLILIVVIMGADSKSEAGSQEQTSAAAVMAEQQENLDMSQADSVNEDDSSEFADMDISGYSLKQDEVPELTALVRTYCDAKEECDPQLLAQVFGKDQLSEAEIAAEQEKMELVKASIKRYENISCYSVEGPEEGSYVMFPYFEIRYRKAEVLMPVLTWAYGTLDENGQYIMTQDVSEDVAEYIKRIGEKEDVQALIAQVQAAADEAVAADEMLQSIYGSKGGSEVNVGQLTEEIKR